MKLIHSNILSIGEGTLPAGVKFHHQALPTINPRAKTAPYFDDTDWNLFITSIEAADYIVTLGATSKIYQYCEHYILWY